METTKILTERISARLALRELSELLGPGFSPAKLSLVERGLIPVTAHDEALILATIRRIASLSRARKEAIEAAREISLREYTRGLRDGRTSACA